MPQIKPTSVQDLLKFIEDHRSDIENGTYDILIEDDWVPQIPHDTILFLVNHCPGSKPSLSKNINTPVSVLEILASDSEDTIRRQVADNPNASVEILTILAKDSAPIIRGIVARHPNVSSDILTYLAEDNSSTAIKGGSLGKPGFESSYVYGRVVDESLSVSGIVADNPRTPSNILAILAKSTDPQTRWLVAQNPNTPADVLAILARDSYNCSGDGYSPILPIQEAVAKNSKTPPDVLKALSESANEYVSKAADPSLYVRKVKKKKQQEALKPCLILFGIIGGICGILYGASQGYPVGGLLEGLLIGVAIGYLWSFLAIFERFS